MKLDTDVSDTPSGPIKTTLHSVTQPFNENFCEQSNTPSSQEKEGKVTAVAAVMTIASDRRPSTKRVSSKKKKESTYEEGT